MYNYNVAPFCKYFCVHVIITYDYVIVLCTRHCFCGMSTYDGGGALKFCPMAGKAPPCEAGGGYAAPIFC